MPKFYITSKDKSGSSSSSVIEATDLNRAVSSAQAQGLFVINVQPLDEQVVAAASTSHNEADFFANRRFTHNAAKLEDIVSFSRQLATMLEAGVPLLRSLSVISAQVESRKLAHVLFQVRNNVEQGETFSKALSKHPSVFGQFWVSLVEVGEASGTLPQILLKLTGYMEDAAKFRSLVVGALIYPGVLFGVVVLAILFFALFIGPVFEKVFKDMGTELPGLTVAMLSLFKFVKTYFFLIVAGIVGAFYLIKAYIKTPVGRWQFESLVLIMPVFGDISRLIIIERFTSQMAVLIDSGVPILYALEISERFVDNLVCGEVIKRIRESVREGKLLAEPMGESGFFPPMAVQMVKVGEETGELGKMLNHVAKYYKQNVEDFMKRFGTLIEPFMLVFMGGIIGVIVISMFMPLFNLSGG